MHALTFPLGWICVISSVTWNADRGSLVQMFPALCTAYQLFSACSALCYARPAGPSLARRARAVNVRTCKRTRPGDQAGMHMLTVFVAWKISILRKLNWAILMKRYHPIWTWFRGFFIGNHRVTLKFLSKGQKVPVMPWLYQKKLSG